MLKYFSLILLGYPLLAFASTDALDDKPESQPCDHNRLNPKNPCNSYAYS